MRPRSSFHDPATAGDRARVRQASLGVGLAVGMASATIVVLVAAAMSWYIIQHSRHETVPSGGRGGSRGNRGEWQFRVIEVGDLIPVIAVLAVLGVVLVALVAWFASERATRPMVEALRIQRNFVADASHELRTPLTMLDSRIQIAQHRLERGGDVAGALRDLHEDAALMTRVLEDLLLAADMSSPTVRGPQTADVGAAVAEAIALVAPQAASRGVSIAKHVPGAVVAGAAPAAVVRAVVILADNALSHSPAGSTISIACTLDRAVTIRVTDEGGGIVGIEPDRVFDRFSRGAGGSRGFGLGLSLVRDIAQRYGGSVGVESTGPRGTTVAFTLPRA